MAITLIELMRGTIKVLPVAYQNRLQDGLKLEAIKVTNRVGVKSRIVSATVRSSTGRGAYNCIIAFDKLQDPERDMPTMVDTPVRVRSSDPSFYFYFAYPLLKIGALYGGRLKPYEPVPDSQRQRAPGPPKNPDQLPGMSKHLWFMVEILKAEGLLK